MRIPRHQRQAGGRAVAGDDPGVAAGVHLAQPVAGGGRVRQLVQAGQRRPVVRLARRHGHQAALGVSLEQRRGPLGAELEGQPQPPQLHLERSHQHVADLVHRQAVPRFPWLRLGLQQAVFDRQRLRAGQEGVYPVAVGRQHVARRWLVASRSRRAARSTRSRRISRSSGRAPGPASSAQRPSARWRS